MFLIGFFFFRLLAIKAVRSLRVLLEVLVLTEFGSTCGAIVGDELSMLVFQVFLQVP
jgi:hypothetical protein